MQGERLILAANGAGDLATVALRPAGIFGEWDAVYVPTVVAKAREGKMKYIIGDGTNLADFTYAGNVAQAHLEVKMIREIYFLCNFSLFIFFPYYLLLLVRCAQSISDWIT